MKYACANLIFCLAKGSLVRSYVCVAVPGTIFKTFCNLIFKLPFDVWCVSNSHIFNILKTLSTLVSLYCLLPSILSTLEQQPVGLSFRRIEKFIVFQSLYEFFWNCSCSRKISIYTRCFLKTDVTRSVLD